LIGTIVNAGSIVFGSLLGFIFRRGFSDRQLELARVGVGIASALIGIDMFVDGAPVLVVLLSLVVGSVLGELVNVDAMLDELGSWLRGRFGGGSTIAESFSASTVLFTVGPMAILGPIQEAISGDLSILLSKSLLDGISSVAISASLGVGVVFSSVPVFAYQGFFFLLGAVAGGIMPATVVAAITSTGGALIFAIGLNLIGVAKIRTGNMMPSLIVAALISILQLASCGSA